METQILSPRSGSDPSSIPDHESSQITLQCQGGIANGSPITSSINSQQHQPIPLFIHQYSPSPSPQQSRPFKLPFRYLIIKKPMITRLPNFISRSLRKLKPPDNASKSRKESRAQDSQETSLSHPVLQAMQDLELGKQTSQSHPVLQALQDLELGKHILGQAIPLATGLMVYYDPATLPLPARLAALALALAFTAIFNGILLRKTWEKFSNASELAGVSLMLLVFYGFLSYHLPEDLLWFPVVCWVLSLLPFGVVFFCREKAPQIGAVEHGLAQA